jgi:hypothetical protein
MKVQNAKIDLYGDFKLDQKRNVNERIRSWVDGKSREAHHPAESPKDSLVLSEESLARLQLEADQTKEASPKEIVYELSAEDKELIALLERFLHRLTGKSVKIIVPEKLILHDPNNLSLQLPDKRQVDLRNQRQGWGLDYHYEETYSEKESMVFSSEGTIETEDGREIEFKISMEMTRQYFSSQRIDIEAGDALIDPLVINYEGSAPKLTRWKTDFDLDGDDQQEKISFLEPGSGFLALDKDNDGSINDGKELFGPNTGDGFSELAAYDEDQNGWIDENDSIFNQLSIWIKDTAGNDQLVTLAQKGIGAIYLKNVDTQYTLKDEDNNLQAQIQKTGIFIREDGLTGIIQHIDLAI